MPGVSIAMKSVEQLYSLHEEIGVGSPGAPFS